MPESPPDSYLPLPRLDDLGDLVGTELSGGPARGFRYLVGEPIGAGTQAVALSAMRLAEAGQDRVVLKVFRPSFVTRFPDIARLVVRKESVALARLNEQVPPSPFVVRMLDWGEIARPEVAAPIPWIALEYVHGGPLGRTLTERVEGCLDATGFAMPPARARRLFGCVARGLAALHAAGVLHRDLRPCNVLTCGAEGEELAKVSDLGVARPMGMKTTFGHGVPIGGTAYAAPEQRDNERVGPWSDVFSLAAIVYTLIAGEPMFKGSSHVALAAAFKGIFEPLEAGRHVHAGFRDAGVLRRLDDVLRRATVCEVTQRTASVEELSALLDPLFASAETQGAHWGAAAASKTRVPDEPEPLTLRVAHRPVAPLGLTSVAFDPDGHALGVSPSGFWYWEGVSWLPLTPIPNVEPGAIRRLLRLGPGRWLACGDDGLVTVFSPRMCELRQQVAPGVTFTAAAATSESAFALSGRGPDRRALVYAFHAGRWATPLVMEEGVVIASVVPAGPGSYHLIGWDRAGLGGVWTYRVESGAATQTAAAPAPLRAGAVDALGAAYAVGSHGTVLVGAGASMTREAVDSDADLFQVAVDPSGAGLAAGKGRLLQRSMTPGARVWTTVWEEPSWGSAWVGLAALSGRVVAAAADGTVVVGE